MGITHFEDAPAREVEAGHIHGRWTYLGEAAGSVDAGVRRIELPAGGWSTPAHEHAGEEELFFVLAGRGLSWQRGGTAQIGEGDCILYRPRRGAHTLHALEPLDVLAFGPRHRDESLALPRLGLSVIGGRAIESGPGSENRVPIQFLREAEVGPPELPDPGERPSSIVNLRDVEARPVKRGRVSRVRRDLATAAGSVSTGLQHVEVEPGFESVPLHCHSVEEEIFVVLGGAGVLVLDDEEETAVRPGHVVARPAGTGVGHLFRAGEEGLTYLAYGTRDPADICFYPRSNKLSFRGVRVIARIERLDYWDGEE
ncbi:MAG TPA: cupin domain-containing protein [Solirubrobacteraceae bacterium]|nr:cupin domain-containing protein [Solirubrobacteraceae bacterium]